MAEDKHHSTIMHCAQTNGKWHADVLRRWDLERSVVMRLPLRWHSESNELGPVCGICASLRQLVLTPSLCYFFVLWREYSVKFMPHLSQSANNSMTYRVAKKSKLLIIAVNEINASQTRVSFAKFIPKLVEKMFNMCSIVPNYSFSILNFFY